MMAPSPEDDNSPKAPDKGKYEKPAADDKDEKSLSNLNDGELKALLDEAITYKNPKDREGKSKLFKDLLHQAEESERIARATSAGGSELVRHCNPSARRSAAAAAQRHHGGGGAGRRKSSRRTASESVRHGGSLDNLAKEELFLETKHTLMVMQDKQMRRTSTAVSARQREGGSLPCDVNSSVVPAQGYQFLEEARTNKERKEQAEYTSIDMESLETQRLLDHDSLAQNFDEERHEVTFVPKFTSRATLQISGTPVDDPIPFQDLDNKKCYDVETLNSRIHSKYNIYIPHYKSTQEEKNFQVLCSFDPMLIKTEQHNGCPLWIIDPHRLSGDQTERIEKVDENGNALHQNAKKKKKTQTDKNVVVRSSESVEGYRSDIIDDLDKLMQFIGGDKEDTSSKTKSNIGKSKQLKQHSEDGATQKKKQRTHSTKGKDSRSELKKSNSLGEISTAKLDNFTFNEKEENNEVVLRSNKGNQNERPKERRSWGNMEPSSFQILSGNTSMENIDATGNWVVTKPKKKSKKRRNSISSGRRQNSPLGSGKRPTNRALSPDLRAKSTCSVPHSERSNDSSDVDSVHSLPIDGLNTPVSYADIAKNSEKLREKKSPSEKSEKLSSKESSPKSDVESKSGAPTFKKLFTEKPLSVAPAPIVPKISQPAPPDFTDAKNFPAMSQDSNKPEEVVPEAPKSTASSETSDESSLKVPEKVTENTKSPQPPDVHNIKNFPAMPIPTVKAVPEKPNVRVISASKTRNMSPPSRGVAKTNITNNMLKLSPRSLKAHNDIQNDLTILHSNEKESIQYNAQMLPPDIPDVRTIEKMHFMNLSLPQMQQQQYHFGSTKGPQNTPVTPSQVPPKDGNVTVSRQTANVVHNNIVNCDSSERTINENNESPPPVVILSGVGNKDVSGLVFGFDVNEQLLNEDTCENFIARYMPPENFHDPTYNHDKIVNFIGSAWETIIGDTNGKVQYYREES